MLGFAFKADTGDTRESASISLIRDFLQERAYVTIYDPKVEEAQIWLDLSEALPSWPLETIKKHVSIVHGALEACTGKEAIVIATEWKEFKEIDWQAVYDGMSKPAFVFDGRMILDVEKLQKIGFTVSWFGCGRRGLGRCSCVRCALTGQGHRSWRPSLKCAPIEMIFGGDSAWAGLRLEVL